MVTKTFVRVPIPISSSKAKAKGGVVATSFGAATTNKSSPIAVDSVITNANDPIDKISQPQKQKHRSKASASRISEEENLPVISFKSIETETATNERAQSLCDHPSRTKRGVQHPGPGDVATAITAEGIFDIDRNLTHGHGKNHYCSNENKEGGKKRRLTPEESTRTRTSRIDDWFQQEYGLQIDLTDVPPQPPISKSSGRMKEGASKYTGVSFNKNKWQAQIMINGKFQHIGHYENEEEAAVDYARALFKYREREQRSFEVDLTDVPPQPPILRSAGHMKNGTSKYAGVSLVKRKNKYYKKRWIAKIMIKGNLVNIGAYDNEEEAAIDYARAVLKYKGKGQGMPEREREQMIPEQIVDKSRCIGDYENEEEAAGDDACAVLKCKDEEALHDREREQILVPMYERAAFPSPVAHRAAVTGAKLKPPEASTEVDFDIFCPPLEPVVPPGIVRLLEAKSLAGENDVLCGRGQLVNSHIGNQLFRELVKDFRPHYPKATDRLKRSIGRSIVLIVRHRGGRFLRTNDADGKLYELGDEKARGKAMQALREGLDVRGTRAGANKKIKRTPHNAEESSERVTNQTMPAPVGFPPPWILPTYIPRPQSSPLPSRHPPYYYGHPPPPPGYERGPTSSMPPYPSPNYQGYPPHPCPYPYQGYPPANNSYTHNLNRTT